MRALLLRAHPRRRRMGRPPPTKMKLAPYAMYGVLSGRGPLGDIFAVAYIWMHILLDVVLLLTLLSPVAERVPFWGPLQLAVQCLCVAPTALILCACVRWYVAVESPPPAAAEQLPPPPPEMDMC